MRLFISGHSCWQKTQDAVNNHTVPHSPHWSTSVKTWDSNATAAWITWQNIILRRGTCNAEVVDSNDEDAKFLIIGDCLQQLQVNHNGIVGVATAGISKCFVLAERTGQKTISLHIGRTGEGLSTQIDWIHLPEEIHGIKKLVWSITDSRLSSPVLYGITSDKQVYRVILEGQSARCSVPGTFAGVAIRDVSTGREHVLFLTTEGSVFSLGLSSRGQLGHGDLESVKEPELLGSFQDIKVKQISAGGWASMALTEHGLVFVWGWNSAGALGFPNRAVREQVDYVGNGVTANQTLETTEMQAEPRHLRLPEEIAWISCGERHAGAVSVTGNVYIWGLNQHGQLGLGDRINRDCPSPVTSLTGRKVSRIECGEWATVFLLDDEEEPPLS